MRISAYAKADAGTECARYEQKCVGVAEGAPLRLEPKQPAASWMSTVRVHSGKLTLPVFSSGPAQDAVPYP
eukprot:15462883-Alexandrium_andersonii.AAC.1